VAAKILIVEDNEMNRDMLSRRLERRGYEICVAGDGRQGIEQAQALLPDLILLDLSLPEIDGWEVARRLKTTPATSHIPIIALTAHAMTGDRDEAIAAGCNDYDTKPIEFQRLLGKIETLLKPAAPVPPGITRPR
jgi:CheY-like chemotaxis protein